MHGRFKAPPLFRVGSLEIKIGVERSGFDENRAENEAPNLNPALVPHLPALEGRLKATKNGALGYELRTPFH